MTFIANARMYAVTAEAEAAWRALLAHVAEAAEIEFAYEAYPAPQPLEALWSRPDLGAVFKCGYPIALGMGEAVPLAAPLIDAAWIEGRAVYRTDLIVRTDSRYRTLAETFGGRLGWTVAHSHSGFNALRHHLLKYRDVGRPLYGEVRGNLGTARKILDAVLAGEIDVGPLDAYWHMLIQKYRPELTAGIRVLESTAVAPAPAFVASPALGKAAVGRLQESFVAAAVAPWFPPLGEALLIRGFGSVEQGDFAETLRWDEEARAAGYLEPA